MLGHFSPVALAIPEIALSLTLTVGPDACWKHDYLPCNSRKDYHDALPVIKQVPEVASVVREGS